MSGDTCGSGCTDCPTCRGEVHPESAAMKDMDFAMAMVAGPQADDLFMGPLSAAQMVRDGIRQRRTIGEDDGRILAYVDALASHRVVVQGAPPSWTPGLPMRDPERMPDSASAIVREGLSPRLSQSRREGLSVRASPGQGPLVADERIPGSAHSVPGVDRPAGSRLPFDDPLDPFWDPVTERKARQVLVTDPLKIVSPDHGKSTRPEEAPPVASKTKCCVEDFIYPTLWYPFETETRYGIHFEGWAKFKEESSATGDITSPTIVIQTCACSCCEFEQLVTLDYAGEGGQSPGGWDEFRQDCFWYDSSDPADVYMDESGQPVPDPDNPKGHKIKNVHPVGQKPPKSDTIHWICPGSKEDAWADKYNAAHPVIYSAEQCRVWTCDEPTTSKSFAAGKIVVKTFVGRIVDVCNGRAVKRYEEFTWFLKGGASRVSIETAGPLPVPMGLPKGPTGCM